MKNLKNGLKSRKNEIKISKILSFSSGIYLMLCFLAPMIISPDMIPELSGRANAIDYANHESWGNGEHGEGASLGHDQSQHGGTFAWSELHPIWAFTYAVGDVNCHQKYERSWEINENQMPVCARDIGILFGFTIGAIFFGFRGFNRWTIRDTFLTIIPDEKLIPIYRKDNRLMAMIGLIILAIIPTGIDGFTQLMTSYESVNSVRMVTGLMAGSGLAWLTCSIIAAKAEYFQSAEDVVLPAGAILRIK